MKRKRKVKKTSFKLIIILLILVFVVIPFTILKMTEDGQYYVEDLSTSEVQASYKHYIFASLKMDTTDSKYTCIKNVLLTILSNARYVDYEKPIEYLYKVIGFLEDETLDNYYLMSNEIECLNNSKIILESNRDNFGYETTKIFNISLNKEDNKYNLPSINYAIKDNVCYIYSIQNKNQNIDNEYTKYIKRKLYKINKNVSDSRNYDNEENILSPTPSFVLALSIFLNILKNNGINLIRFITFMPDRYFEKIGSDFDVTKIQYNLTQKLYYLIERIKYHYNIDINYPIFENINLYNIEDVGDDIVIDISNLIISNNEFLNNIVNSISKDKINKIM